VKNIWSSKEEDTEDECDEEAQNKVIDALRQQIKDIQASHTEFLHNLVLTLVLKSQEKIEPKLSPAMQAYMDRKKADNGVKQTGKAP